MRRLFIQGSNDFAALAETINEVALVGFTRQLRDGLNIGGGDYYLYELTGRKVVLVHNDVDHPDVFVPSEVRSPFSMYVFAGDDGILDAACRALTEAGLQCHLADEF
jgi:hypothetical protein